MTKRECMFRIGFSFLEFFWNVLFVCALAFCAMMIAKAWPK
jgi:hypothetical protein